MDLSPDSSPSPESSTTSLISVNEEIMTLALCYLFNFTTMPQCDRQTDRHPYRSNTSVCIACHATVAVM